MEKRADLLRVDSTGTIHSVGRTASQEMRARIGEWRLLPGPRDVCLIRPAVAGATLRMAGELRVPGAICDIVAMAAQSSWTGEIVVIDADGQQRSIYLDGGTVVGASTNVPAERLGETLYSFGVITRAQLDAILVSSTASGKRVGEAAIDLEFVSAEELFPMMARQVEEVFYAALRVGEGAFYVFDRFDESQLPRRHNMSAGALLMEGARRMDEMRFFRERIPNDEFIPTPKRDVKPPDELADAFAQCDGKRSIAEIGRRTGQLEFEVTRAVYQLLQGGFITVTASRPQGAVAIVKAFNPALIDIHARCDAEGKGAELRDALGRFATGALVFDPLFFGAGPHPNGSFTAERVTKNLAAVAGEDPDAWLVQLLEEYVAFALFQAGSLLPREVESQLAAEVTEMLKPVRAPESIIPPASLRK